MALLLHSLIAQESSGSTGIRGFRLLESALQSSSKTLYCLNQTGASILLFEICLFLSGEEHYCLIGSSKLEQINFKRVSNKTAYVPSIVSWAGTPSMLKIWHPKYSDNELLE